MTDAVRCVAIEPSEQVWVLPTGHGGDRRFIHTERDCHVLENSEKTPSDDKTAAMFPSRRVCAYCAGTVGDNRTSLAQLHVDARAERIDTVTTILENAPGPLSAKDIRLEAMLSGGAVRRVLGHLADDGVVERVSNPDDGRVPLYQLQRVDELEAAEGVTV